MNTRELLEKAITHVIKQGVPSKGANGHCRYRGNGGTMCAVGALIPNNLYTIQMESRSVHATIVIDAIAFSIGCPVDGQTVEYLSHVQTSHDTAAYNEKFLEKFKSEIIRKVSQKDLPDYCLEFIN